MMKGEYVEERKDQFNTMFAKLHQTQKFHHHHPYQQPPPPPLSQAIFHHPFQLSAPARECQNSDDTDSRSPTTPSTATNTAKKQQPISPQPNSSLVVAVARTSSSGNDGASIEVVRRPRGRPPGSKNKAKPPVIITREAEPTMSPYIFELPGGVDLIDSVTRFCRRRNMGVCVLNGSGSVSNVTIRQPATTPGGTVTFHGRFEILSISATVVVGPSSGGSFPPHNGIVNGFTISLGGPQGQVVGGVVAGPLLSAGTVYLISATFSNPSYHRLPADEMERKEGRDLQNSPEVSGGVDRVVAAAEACGVPMYSCHMPSDVIWAPTARQPPPY
ncbi:unnamed protein product [Cuscuta europaea]|uniref:PPC domain-containing protein n=1 Tax=Cuscuta europaea TaxID=41803 RepID=A0A9P0VMK5_CUSEU|nr:unnamed protein product [Cuscuta europaea]